jgi:hypothetical protein
VEFVRAERHHLELDVPSTEPTIKIEIKASKSDTGNGNKIGNTVKTPSTPTSTPTPRRMNIAMWKSNPEALVRSSRNMDKDS